LRPEPDRQANGEGQNWQVHPCILQALLGRFEGEDEVSSPIWLVRDTPALRKLMLKISKNARPGSITFLSDSEMALLKDIYTLEMPEAEVPTITEQPNVPETDSD